MKTSFNSIGKTFKKLFGRKSQQATTPVVANAVKKQEQAEKRHKVVKMSDTAQGRKWRNIAAQKASRKRNKILRRRKHRKIARKSRQVNYRIAA